MSDMIVKIKWDGDDLGPMWMNLDNLELLLYGKHSTKRELVQVEEISHSEKSPHTDMEKGNCSALILGLANLGEQKGKE